MTLADPNQELIPSFSAHIVNGSTMLVHVSLMGASLVFMASFSQARRGMGRSLPCWAAWPCGVPGKIGAGLPVLRRRIHAFRHLPRHHSPGLSPPNEPPVAVLPQLRVGDRSTTRCRRRTTALLSEVCPARAFTASPIGSKASCGTSSLRRDMAIPWGACPVDPPGRLRYSVKPSGTGEKPFPAQDLPRFGKGGLLSLPGV